MKWLLGVTLMIGLAAAANARPGGGHSYSSGSHSSSSRSYSSSRSSSGSSSSGAGFVIALLVGGGLLIAIVLTAAASRESAWDSQRTRPQPPPRLDLSALHAGDPDFSRPVFEDFAYQLYAAAQRARHDPAALDKLAPYLAPQVRSKLAQRGSRVDQVVIGSLRIVAASAETESSRIVVSNEANLASRSGTLATKERWAFARAAGVKSRAPQRIQTWPCPNCGAPWRAGADAKSCAHCNTAIESGRFEWTVEQIWIDAEADVGATLTGTVEEIGNDFPTVEDPAAQMLLMKLRQDDANITWESFTARVTMIYARLAEAWNAQNLTPVRGLVTSSLLAYLTFWTDEYKRQHLANKLEDGTIKHITLAKTTRDKYYDAITVRVYASGLDFTLAATGNVVGGSRDVRREYTEYWTFLRSSARRGPITTTPACPNCSAPLAISNAGACTHCNVEIESGSFDWVLSKIEQDDVYRG